MRIIIALWVLPWAANAAVVSGKITDENDEPLPYVSVYLAGTTQGATSNKEGSYSLEIPEGSHEIVFKYIGYKTRTEIINASWPEQKIMLNVKMEPQPYEITEVTVNANAEDPAYEIIRRAIKMRNYYHGQVKSYSCNVYIKGLQRVTSYPKKFMGYDVNSAGEIDPKTGIFYLSESVSKFYFKQPDKVHEVMLSSKVSGNSKAFSFNRAADLLLDFYKNYVTVNVIAKRGFVSPIGESALFYYNFRFAGIFYENGKAVNKIEVIPKRKADPVFRGYIYICENTWRIHSTDLYLIKDAGIEVVDTLRINQVHLPVKSSAPDDVWMLFSNKLTFSFSILSFKGNGVYVSIHSKYDVKPDMAAVNPVTPATQTVKVPAPAPKERKEKKKEQKQENKIFSSGEIMKVEDDANKKDSTYWEEARPVPLTEEELSDYKKKDSMETVRTSKQFLDSVDRRANRFRPADLIFGYSHTNRYKKRELSFSPLIQNVQFNTVQGWVVHTEAEFRKKYESERQLFKTVSASYGFSDKRINAAARVLYEHNPKTFTHFFIEGGRKTTQFSDKLPISPLVNSVYSLFLEENFMKLYQKDYWKFSYNSELANGIYLRSFIEYSARQPLMNTTDFSFVKKVPAAYTSNNPLFPANDSAASFTPNEALELRLNLRLRYRQRYVSRPDDKWVFGSKYPTLHLEYRKGIPGAGGTDANYDLARISVTDRMNFHLLGKASYLVSAGKFLNSSRMELMDYYHFSGNKTIFSNFDFSDFQLLDYYTYSTKEYFAEVHYEHDFSGFILNKFPLMRKLKLNELAGVHFLHTEKMQNYVEVFFGIEKFNFARADFVMAFSQGRQLSAGFRIGLKVRR